ncbi:MAG: LemA family protein [Bacilli bacterium]|nr:LemA family protein [Bacilli bacterium]
MLLLYIGLATLFLILLVVLTIYLIRLNNNLAKLEVTIKKEYSNIDVSLKKRADLIPKLVDSVKAYMKHENDLLTEITKIRMDYKNEKELMDIDEKTTSLLKNIFMLAENYPDLKASSNFLKLQEELSNVDEDIAHSRITFNKSVLNYNNVYLMFPTRIFAKIMGFKKHEFFKVNEEERNMPNLDL